MHRTQNLTAPAADTDDQTVITPANILHGATRLTRSAPRCDRCHQPTDDLGFGYSREPDTDQTTVSAPVPDGVEGIFLTGRTSDRAAA